MEAVAPGSPARREPAGAAEWVGDLVQQTFFRPCAWHGVTAHHFCLDCRGAGPACPACLGSAHGACRTLQIRRSSYRDAARLSELRHANAAGIQVRLRARVRGARAGGPPGEPSL